MARSRHFRLIWEVNSFLDSVRMQISTEQDDVATEEIGKDFDGFLQMRIVST